MNQKASQKATSSAEGDFYKLLNNYNFGIDNQNNIDNYILGPLYDEVTEIYVLKNFVLFSVMIPTGNSFAQQL